MSSFASWNSMVHRHNSFLISILDSSATFYFRHICLAILPCLLLKENVDLIFESPKEAFLKSRCPDGTLGLLNQNLWTCAQASVAPYNAHVIPTIPRWFQWFQLWNHLSLTFSLFPHPSLPPPWWELSEFSDGNGIAGSDLLLFSLQIFLPVLQKGKGPGLAAARCVKNFPTTCPKT